MDPGSELRRQLQEMNLDIGQSAIKQLLRLQDELLRWNKTYNLTSITEPLDVIEKHLVDSLTLLTCIGKSQSLLDIGSGAGFPSLPVKIVRPELAVVSVDSVAKKIRFQKHMVRKLGLEGYTAWHGRAEDVPAEEFAAGGFDLIVARAFSSLEKLVELALPCLQPAGRIIAMKGPEGETELNEASQLLKSKGLRCKEIIKLQLPASGAGRQLLFLAR